MHVIWAHRQLLSIIQQIEGVACAVGTSIDQFLSQPQPASRSVPAKHGHRIVKIGTQIYVVAIRANRYRNRSTQSIQDIARAGRRARRNQT